MNMRYVAEDFTMGNPTSGRRPFWRLPTFRRTAASAACLSALALTLSAPPASASDWGGSGPTLQDCTYGASLYTVGPAVNLYYPGGELAGTVEVRWSNWCPSSNWARLTSSITANRLSLSIRENSHPTNGAGADDYNASQNWTRTIRLLDGPSSSVCAYADIYSYKGRASGVACR